MKLSESNKSSDSVKGVFLCKAASLLNVKTIVTFVVMAVFAVLAERQAIDAQITMQIVTMVVAFYFGTQHEKGG